MTYRNGPRPAIYAVGGSRHVIFAIFCVLLLSIVSSPAFSSEGITYKDGYTLKADTVWSGTVLVGGVVFVPEGITLKIAPGTKILFKKLAAPPENAENESRILIPGSGIRVEGNIIARG